MEAPKETRIARPSQAKPFRGLVFAPESMKTTTTIVMNDPRAALINWGLAPRLCTMLPGATM